MIVLTSPKRKSYPVSQATNRRMRKRARNAFETRVKRVAVVRFCKFTLFQISLVRLVNRLQFGYFVFDIITPALIFGDFWTYPHVI